MAHYVLLHGALGSTADLEPIKQYLLLKGHQVQVLQLDPVTAPCIPDMVHRLEAFLLKIGTPVRVFGYSMGGYVALCLALKSPQLFEEITTLAVKLNWTVEVANQESAWMQVEIAREKFPLLCQQLQALHGERWGHVVDMTAVMMQELAAQPYLNVESVQQLHVPVNLLLGSLDRLVSFEETQTIANAMPKGVVKLLEGVKHPLSNSTVEMLLKVLDQNC